MGATCVLVGDVMMDVTARIESEIAFASDTPARVSLQPGGAAANTAAWMAVSGSRAALVGCIGRDAFGTAVRDELTALGVELHLTTSGTRATGTCIVIVDQARERTMFPDSGANSELSPDAFRDGVISASSHVHVSGYTLLNPGSREAGLAAIAMARHIGATCSVDPASAGPLAHDLDTFTQVLPSLDVLIANESEAAVLSGAPDTPSALLLLSALVPVVVIKRGAAGVIARSPTEAVDIPALAAAVVDTTGAGDAFTAGFLPAWIAGSGLREAVDAGQRLAVAAVSRVGASPMVR